MSAPQQLSGFNNQIPPRYSFKAITAAYTVSGADYGLTLVYQGAAAVTITLPPASVVGAGFNCWIWNQPSAATAAVTVTPTGGSTIDGIANILVPCGQGTQIVSDGLNWQTGSKKTMKLYSEASTSYSKPQTTGQNAVAIGSGSIASATAAYALGVICTSSQPYAYSFGNNAVCAVTGKTAFGSAYLGNSGVWGTLSLAANTTNATVTALTADGGAASATNQLLVPSFGAVVFSIFVVARQSGAAGTASAAWKIEGLIRQESSQATTVLVASTVTAISNVPAWVVAVTANTTLGSISINVTGAVATNITWLATVYTSEIIAL